MAKEILINQLFAGRYLREGENIGHEVINMFEDDDGNHNLFITPSGYVKNHDLEYVLFVRNVNARKTVEVVGLASGIRAVTSDEIHAARYAGASLNQIFSNNIYHGKRDDFAEHITFRAKKFLLPSHRILISIDNNYVSSEYVMHLKSERQVIIPQGMREYYSSQNDATAYLELKKLIENTDLWETDKTTEKLLSDGISYNQSPSFLEVIRKEDDENVFSNLLTYFFEYSHRSFLKFANNILGITDMSFTFTVYRETKERVDIWIEGEKDIIIIENKIKSGINGITEDDFSQLNKYKTAGDEVKKYGKNVYYYIFAPDYAKFDLSKFGLKDTYKIVRYSDIYNFFIKETETYISDRVFPDFLRGLKRHTLTYSELQFDIMRSRLLRKINIIQQAEN